MKTLKDIFEDNTVEQIPGFMISFISHPFKTITITPAKLDGNGLLTFDIHSEYLCGMRYTSFATNYLYSRRFYADSTMNDVIGYIRDVLNKLSESIHSTKNEGI